MLALSATSRRQLFVILLRILQSIVLLILGKCFFANVIEKAGWIGSDNAARWRDLTQDFLAVQAIRHGVNPYLPITELSSKFESVNSLVGFNHPTPHSPIILTLFSFLPEMSESLLHTVWLLSTATIFIFCACVVCYRIRKRGVSLLGGAILVALSMNATSIEQDLIYGQQNAVILPFVLLLWVGIKRQSGISGMALGACLALRGFGLPFILAFLVERRFKDLLFAFFVFCSFQLASISILGHQVVTDFFLKYTWAAVDCWRGQPANLSLMTLPAKLLGSHMVAFGGTHAVCQEPHIPVWIMMIGPILSLLVCIRILARSVKSDSESRFCLLLLLSILFSPLTWPHYFVLLMPSALVAVVEIKNQILKIKRGATPKIVALTILILLFHSNWIDSWYKLSGSILGDGVHLLSEWHLAASCLPTFASLLFLLYCPQRVLCAEVDQTNHCRK